MFLEALDVTVAVKVTFCPKLEGLTEDENARRSSLLFVNHLAASKCAAAYREVAVTPL